MKLLFNNNVLSGLLQFRGDIIEHYIGLGHEVVLIAPRTEDASLLKRVPNGAKLHQINMERDSVSPLNDLKYLNQLIKILRTERPDYVFNYTIKPNIYGSIACKLLGIPCTSMLAGLGYSFSHNNITAKLARALYRFALRFARHVIFLNEGNVNTARETNLCNPKKMIWLKGGEGVNLKTYNYTDNASNQNLFLFIARLIKEKGYCEFVEAAKLIKEENPSARFLVAGGFSPTYPSHITKEEIERDVKNGIIEYLGVIKDMPALYATPGIAVVIPSYYSEGLNRSLMEACAVGKPIITTRIAGCQETVLDGKNGFLVEPKSVEELYEAIKKYISLPQETKNDMSVASRQLAEEKFDINNVITVYDEILRQDIGFEHGLLRQPTTDD